MILVDTCVWIDFLSGKSGTHIQQLETALATDVVCIDSIIFCELCFGAKGGEQYKRYADYFGGLRRLVLPENWELSVSNHRFKLKSKGITTYLADALIAETAIYHSVPLLTLDRGFLPWKQHCQLQLL